MGELQQPMNKMIFKSFNNSKSFANGSKSIIRNNLGLCKHSEINDIQEGQKRRWNSVVRWKKVMSEICLKCL